MIRSRRLRRVSRRRARLDGRDRILYDSLRPAPVGASIRDRGERVVRGGRQAASRPNHEDRSTAAPRVVDEQLAVQLPVRHDLARDRRSCSSSARSSPRRPSRRRRGAACSRSAASSPSSPSARCSSIMMGGIDLSMAAAISLLANVLVGVSKGQDDRLAYADLRRARRAPSSSASSTACWSPCSISTR